MPPTGSDLSTLPDELVLEIISHISPTRNLRSLSLTSHRFHRLTLESLYGRYTYSHGDSELFLRTITSTPCLSNQVKSISWDYLYENDLRSGVLTTGFHSCVDKKLIASQLKARNTPYSRRLASVLPSKTQKGDQIWLETFLLFAPKIEELKVEETYRWDDHVYWFSAIRYHPELFHYLKSACIQGPLRIENIAPLLVLPSMRKLELTQVTRMRKEFGSRFEWERLSKRFDGWLELEGSNIEELHLRHSYIDLGSLACVFGACRALKVFEYEHVYNNMSAVHDIEFNFSALAVHLKHQIHSLEHLRLRHYHHWLSIPVTTTHSNLASFLNSLQSFANLRSLDLGALSFDNETEMHSRIVNSSLDSYNRILQHLPKQIVSLSFEPDQRHAEWRNESLVAFSHVLKHIASQIATHLPNVKEVALVDWFPWVNGSNFPPDGEEIQKRFAETGITFSSRPRVLNDRFDIRVEDIEDGWLRVYQMINGEKH